MELIKELYGKYLKTPKNKDVKKQLVKEFSHIVFKQLKVKNVIYKHNYRNKGLFLFVGLHCKDFNIMLEIIRKYVNYPHLNLRYIDDYFEIDSIRVNRLTNKIDNTKVRFSLFNFTNKFSKYASYNDI